jgi:hypothetical protein
VWQPQLAHSGAIRRVQDEHRPWRVHDDARRAEAGANRGYYGSAAAQRRFIQLAISV